MGISKIKEKRNFSSQYDSFQAGVIAMATNLALLNLLIALIINGNSSLNDYLPQHCAWNISDCIIVGVCQRASSQADC